MREPYSNAESEEQPYTAQRWQDELVDYMTQHEFVRRVATYQRADVMTLDKGLVIVMPDGERYHITITYAGH